MDISSEVNNIIIGLGYFSIGNLLLTTVCDLGWIVYCITECWRVGRNYRICKQTPDLHPIYRDVQYLSRQRKLYNLKTHFVKYGLMALCLSVEMCGIISLVSFLVLSYEFITIEMNKASIHIQSKYPHCYNIYQVAYLIFSPSCIIIYNCEYLLIFLLSILLSILTRYLAARYLNHSFKRTLTKYILWLLVQSIVVLLCSTAYTTLLSLVLFPLLILINWLVLVRDSRILSRVLRSNLREIEYHSNNKILYREQLSAYRFYRIFQTTLLISLFSLVVVTIMNSIDFLLLIAGKSTCLLHILIAAEINSTLPNIIHFSHSVNSMLLYSETLIVYAFPVVYSLSTSLPIVCVTLFPLIRLCVNRYKSRRRVYRYNYENIKKPLLKGYN